MNRTTLRLNQQGYTLVELAIATLILGTMASSVMMARTFMAKQVVATNDQAYASEKAIQMYEELRALVGGNEQGVKILDNYDSGSGYDPILTTDKTVDTGLASANPADPLSGNKLSNGHWRYLRQVTVIPVPNDEYARQVTVRLFKYASDSNPTAGGTLLAVIGGVLRSISQIAQPSQVFDLYILQINTIPAWWADMNTLDQYMVNAIADIQSRNTGLIIRPHYITRSAYGRDPFYSPYTNYTQGSDQAASPWVYFYPGMVPQLGGTNGCGCEAIYYNPGSNSFPDNLDTNSLLMDGSFMVDNNTVRTSSASQFPGCPSYTAADQYNHGMRYPDEVALYQAVTAAAVSVNAAAATAASGVVSIANNAITEISERMLIEGMLSSPASFQNSMIINLHGELLPLPPMRNYSDAAKDPGGMLTKGVTIGGNYFAPTDTSWVTNLGTNGTQGLRVVAHPELLYYPGNSSSATSVTFNVRVYAYYETMDGISPPSNNPLVPSISLFFPDASVTLQTAKYIFGSSGTTYVYDNMVTAGSGTNITAAATAVGDSASVTAQGVGPGSEQTLITLYNTQANCLATAGNHGGLNQNDNLYGAQYIPCDVSGYSTTFMGSSYLTTPDTFGNDLTMSSTVTATPKNTARWVLTFAAAIHPTFNTVPVTVEGPGSSLNVSGGVTYGGSVSIYSSAHTFSGMRTLELRLGNAVTTCNVPGTIAGVFTTLYNTPNLERTYIWTGESGSVYPNGDLPPYTERYQFLGDPRDCPYWDVKNGGITNFASGSAPPVTIGPYAYNWWFKNGAASGSGSSTIGMNLDGYVSFGQSGNTNSWSDGGTNIQDDIPRYFQMIRQGLMSSSSIWATTNGWSFYYYGLGDEIGFDHPPFADGSGTGAVANGGIQIIEAPFRTTKTGTTTVVQTYDNINYDSASDLQEEWVAATTSTLNTWFQRSWIGEIYPDSMYNAVWSVYGNLPSVATNLTLTAPATETYYLQAMSQVPIGTGNETTNGFMGTKVAYNKMTSNGGDTSFFNGLDAGGNNYYTDNASGTNGTALALGVTCYSIFGYPLPNSVGVQREWGISSSNNNGGTPEWSIAPYTTLRSTIAIPSVNSLSRIFYDSDQGSPWNGVGLVELKKVTSGVTQVGYVLESGTSPSANVGAADLAENALIFTLRSFLDGGQMPTTINGSTIPAGHIYQLPAIQAYPQGDNPEYANPTSIPITIASPVTQTSGVTIVTPISDIWWRFKGQTTNNGNYYTEEYPNYGLPMTTTGAYSEACSVVYNFKYYNDNNVTNKAHVWQFAADNSNAVTGVYVSSEAVTNIQPFTYTWDVSNTTNFPQGGYDFMVEAYRYFGPITAQPAIIPEHYSWHMVHITIDR